jgi:hypothetical protein
LGDLVIDMIIKGNPNLSTWMAKVEAQADDLKSMLEELAKFIPLKLREVQ